MKLLLAAILHLRNICDCALGYMLCNSWSSHCKVPHYHLGLTAVYFS